MSDLVAALTALARSRAEEGYHQRQDLLARQLPCAHEALVDAAYDGEEAFVRIEALELVDLLAKDGFQVALSDSMKADPDPGVRDHAKALLFRAIVNERIRRLGRPAGA